MLGTMIRVFTADPYSSTVDLLVSTVLSTKSMYRDVARVAFWMELKMHASGRLLKDSFRKAKTLVEMSGIEPLTPCLQGRCSPS